MLATQKAKRYTQGDGWTDNTRLDELGWKSRQIEESIRDTLEWLEDNLI